MSQPTTLRLTDREVRDIAIARLREYIPFSVLVNDIMKFRIARSAWRTH